MNATDLLHHYARISEAPDAILKLRRFVLDLAVRGKLVEQDATDEPAAELLKRIAQKKAEAEQDDRRSKKTSLPEVDEQEVAVPAGWVMVSLGEITRIRTGKLDANAAVAGGEFPFFTCSQTPLEIDTFSFDTEAILLAGNGDFNLKAYCGKFDAYQRTYVIEPVGWDLWFCFVLIKSQISKITNNQRGSAIPYLKLGDITSPIVPLPPLAEQHRIVAKVDELMALCDRLEEARTAREGVRDKLTAASLARLTAPDETEQDFQSHARFALQSLPSLTTRPDQIKTLRQTILNLAVRGKLVAQDPTDEPAAELLKRIAKAKALRVKAGQIPKKADPVRDPVWGQGIGPSGWSEIALGQVTDVITSGSRGWGEFYSKTGPGFVRAQNIRFGKLRLDDLACVNPPSNSEGSRTQVVRNDLLIVITGAGVTNPALLDQDLGEAYVSQHVGLVRPSDTALSPWLLHCLLADSGGRAELVKRAYGAGKPGLNLDNIRNLTIPLPPLAEQHRIVARVDALMALCDQLESSLTTATTTRSRLLQALLHEALGHKLEAAE